MPHAEQPDRHILVVDDEADIREMLRTLLELEGYRVTALANGRLALAYLRQTASLPALLLLDLTMPVMDGWEFYRSYAAEPAWRSIALLVMSAGLYRARVAEEMPLATFVPKPFLPAPLLTLIATRLARDTQPLVEQR